MKAKLCSEVRDSFLRDLRYFGNECAPGEAYVDGFIAVRVGGIPEEIAAGIKDESVAAVEPRGARGECGLRKAAEGIVCAIETAAGESKTRDGVVSSEPRRELRDVGGARAKAAR